MIIIPVIDYPIPDFPNRQTIYTDPWLVDCEHKYEILSI